MGTLYLAPGRCHDPQLCTAQLHVVRCSLVSPFPEGGKAHLWASAVCLHSKRRSRSIPVTLKATHFSAVLASRRADRTVTSRPLGWCCCAGAHRRCRVSVTFVLLVLHPRDQRLRQAQAALSANPPSLPSPPPLLWTSSCPSPHSYLQSTPGSRTLQELLFSCLPSGCTWVSRRCHISACLWGPSVCLRSPAHLSSGLTRKAST